MLINNNETQKVKLNTLKPLLLLITVSLFPFTQVTANELNTDQYTVSHGVVKKGINEQQRINIIEKNKLTALPDQLTGKASAKTRTSILKGQTQTFNKAKNKSYSQAKSSNHDADFTIYSATSFLYEDYDGDGYYQTFSVTFDADIYSYTDNQLGEVYALLYLSKNGGPWTHYFTTDTFLIEGDTDSDEYEVISTFVSGYASDHYDVLIDLYHIGHSDIVASFSSDDSDALYALPIESADYDEPYVEVIEVVEHSGGSMYWLVFLLLNIVLLRIKK